jgi:hypothetical protein
MTEDRDHSPEPQHQPRPRSATGMSNSLLVASLTFLGLAGACAGPGGFHLGLALAIVGGVLFALSRLFRS